MPRIRVKKIKGPRRSDQPSHNNALGPGYKWRLSTRKTKMVEGSSRGEAEDALGEGQGKREERKRPNREAGRSHEGEPREPGAGKGCKHVPF